jgi:hypothetical protein
LAAILSFGIGDYLCHIWCPLDHDVGGNGPIHSDGDCQAAKAKERQVTGKIPLDDGTS